MGVIIFLWDINNGKYLICRVNTLKTEVVIYPLDSVLSFGIHGFFPKLHLKRVQKCHLGTGTSIRHSVISNQESFFEYYEINTIERDPIYHKSLLGLFNLITLIAFYLVIILNE